MQFIQCLNRYSEIIALERKQSLHSEQKVTDISAVDQAAGWADVLIKREHRGPGDTLDAARHRAAQKHKLPERVLWALRYRRPKDLMASVYLKIEAAFENECQRQEAKLAHELEITKATLAPTPSVRRLIAETEEFLRSVDGQEAGATAQSTPEGSE